MWKKVKWALALAGVPVVLGYLGCLDDPSVPELAGPSEFAQSLEMRAIPDQLTADGWSSSVIEVIYRNENGARIGGQTIQFDLGARETVGLGGGVFYDLGNLAPLDGPRPTAGGEEARALSAVTGSDGVARVRYWAPFRSDQANDGVVTITARPAGTDFRAAIFRQVDIMLRAADRPNFPGTETCSIIVEPQREYYPVNEVIFFTAGQVSGVARYEWDFGDRSSPVVARSTEHTYRATGDYTVTLYQTAEDGSQSSCTAEISVTTDGGAPPVPPTPPIEEECPTPFADLDISNLCYDSVNDTTTIIADGANRTFFSAGGSNSGGVNQGYTIVEYRWNFGDGSTQTTTTPNTSHVYSTAFDSRQLTITVTIVNSCGEVDGTSVTLIAEDSCPP